MAGLAALVGAAFGGKRARAQTPEAERPQPRKKKFFLDATDIRPIAVGFGGCIATDRITVDGAGVGYLYRTRPIRPEDSGWCFTHGDETDAYMDDAANSGIYDVNTIANYSPEITPHLEAPIGSAFYRDGNEFRPDPLGAPIERD